MYAMQEVQEARDVLGVDDTTSAVDIKKAYRKQALIHHPDKNKNDLAQQRMQALNNAHELLHQTDNGKETIIDTLTVHLPIPMQTCINFMSFSIRI